MSLTLESDTIMLFFKALSLQEKVHLLTGRKLGPTINLHRSPLGGRSLVPMSATASIHHIQEATLHG